MKKVSIEPSNRFCPQALFLYGTYKEDGSPNFGLFCWLSYCWDGELNVMACIGGEKLTKDRIRAGGVFSANLVTESLLPLADYFGSNEGYDEDKMKIPVRVTEGKALRVPVLEDSPWSYELEVKQAIPMDDSELYLCRIRNVLAAEELVDESSPIDDRMRRVSPIITAGVERYYTMDKTSKGAWGDWKDLRQH